MKLGIEIARRILRRELSTDPSAILGLVKAALERVDARDVFRVRAHPEDARTLDACFADLGMPERIEVVADQNLERGAVILETAKGQLDASVETQLQEIRARLCRPHTHPMNQPVRIDLDPYIQVLSELDPMCWSGQVRDIVGLLVESEGPAAGVGDFCEIRTGAGRSIRTQVIGFREGRVLLLPLEETDGLQAGDIVVARSSEARVTVGPELLGRVLDGFGRPIDGSPHISGMGTHDLYAAPPGPLEREPIQESLVTGIRAIDSLHDLRQRSENWHLRWQWRR